MMIDGQEQSQWPLTIRTSDRSGKWIYVEGTFTHSSNTYNGATPFLQLGGSGTMPPAYISDIVYSRSSHSGALAAVTDESKAYVDQQTGELKAERVIKADSNGKVSGVHLLAKGSGADAGGKLYFQADEIAIVPPSWNPSTESDAKSFPFYFSEDRKFMYLDEAVIRRLSAENIDSGSLVVDGLSLMTNDLSLPAGVIKGDMIDPAFKDGIVRVNPDAEILGGTKNADFRGLSGNKTLTLAAIKSGGSAHTINVRVVGPNLAGRHNVSFRVAVYVNNAVVPFTGGDTYKTVNTNVFDLSGGEPGVPSEWRSSMSFEAEIITGNRTENNNYTYELRVTSFSSDSSQYASKISVSIGASEPSKSSGGFITDVRWGEVKEQPSFVALDTEGSGSYPRMFAGNNPASSNIWLRVPATNGGLLPYSNGNSSLGTSSWKFKEVHGVNLYENGTALSSKYLGKTATAVNADKVANTSVSESYTKSTIAKRNSSGDLLARLFRSNYQNQSTISGAIAYRNSTSDNYIRFCSDMDAVREFVGVYSKSETVSKSSDSTITGRLSLTNSVPIALQDYHFINRKFVMTENANPQWILLCEDAGNNDVNGTITMDRSSGYYQSVVLEVIVSASSSSMVSGAMRTLQVMNAGEVYKLVRCTYDGVKYIAIKCSGGNYYATTGAYFTGRLRASSPRVLLSVASGVTDESAFGYNTKAVHEVDAMFVRDGKVWHSANDGAGSGLDADSVDGKHASSFATAGHGHTGLSTNPWNGLRSQTGYGFIDFGPANTSYAHIHTDRPFFHFNKGLFVDGDAVYTNGNTDFLARKGSKNVFTKTQQIDVTGTALILGGSGLQDAADLDVYIGNQNPATGYGYTLSYKGSGSGINNALLLTASNGGSPVNVVRFVQDGAAQFYSKVGFDKGIRVGTNGETIGSVAANASNGWLFVGSGTEGLGIDNNEIACSLDLIISAPSTTFNGTVYFKNTIDVKGGLVQDGHTVLNGSDTWLRTKGSDGVYFSTYGGGWRMTDSTWIKAYGGKALLIQSTNSDSIRTSGGIAVERGLRRDNRGSSWVSQKDSQSVAVYNAEAVNSNAYAAALRQKHATTTYTLGGLGDNFFGIFAYYNNRTANGTDGYFHMDVTGNCKASGKIEAKSTTGVISRVLTFDDFLPSTPPADLENTITANWIGAGAINARHLQVNSLVNDGGTYTSFKVAPDATRPLALSRTTSSGEEISPIFYVDTKGNGFFDGKLSKDTVDIDSIQEEARKQINPYYIGTVSGSTQTSTNVAMSSGGTHVLATVNVLGGKVNLSWEFSGTKQYFALGGNQGYTAPTWRVEVFRGSSTSSTRIVDRTYTGSAYNNVEREIGFWDGQASIYINDQFSDNTSSSSQRYTIRVTRVSGTSTPIKLNRFVGSSPAFKRIEMKYDYTSLYYNASGLGAGNITLSDDYDKYEFLAVAGAEDNDDVMGITLIPTHCISEDTNKFDNNQFMLSSPGYGRYWRVQLSGKRTLYDRGENSIIRRIWGVNIVEKT